MKKSDAFCEALLCFSCVVACSFKQVTKFALVCLKIVNLPKILNMTDCIIYQERWKNSHLCNKRGRSVLIYTYTNPLLFGSLFSPQTPPPEPDQSALWRKCHSQFTDVDDYRRHGRNTWQDESGVYANSMIKEQTIKPTNPIPERLA